MNPNIPNEPSPPSDILDNSSAPKPAAVSTEEAQTAGAPAWEGHPAAASETAVPEAIPAEHSGSNNKRQLHQRVDERMRELELALGQLAGSANSERAHAISAAMENARVAMGGGWDRVGEQEAKQLSQWLSSTEDLRATSPLMPVASLE